MKIKNSLLVLATVATNLIQAQWLHCFILLCMSHKIQEILFSSLFSKSDVGKDIISYMAALNSLLRLVYTAQSFHIKRKIFCCRLTSRLHNNWLPESLRQQPGKSQKPNLLRSRPSQKKRREPESGVAHFAVSCVSTGVSCTSSSTNSDGLLFRLFVLWVCALTMKSLVGFLHRNPDVLLPAKR